MKGFMHIVEIILVVILVFFIFVQFSYIPTISTDWSSVKLIQIGNDVMHTLDKKGIDWFDRNLVVSEMESILPENVIYAVDITGSPKSRIEVACVECDSTEMSRLDDILDPGYVVINDRTITFNVAQTSSVSEAFSLDYDVALFFDKKDIDERELRTFLRNRKGVIEIFDIDDPSILDGIQNQYFGIGWDDALAPDSSPIRYSDISLDPRNELYEAYKWSVNTPMFFEAFDNLNAWGYIGSYVQDGRLVLPSGACNSGESVYSYEYDEFREGEISFDVSIEPDAMTFVRFRRQASGQSYVARISGTSSPHSFVDGSSIETPVGTNSDDSIDDSEVHEVKVLADGNNFTLYVDGRPVANYVDASSSYNIGGIGFFSRCDDVRIDNVHVTLKENHQFDNFLGASEKVRQFEGDPKKVLLEQDDAKSALLNYRIAFGEGRTVWISDMPTLTPERKALLKSLIMWASGDSHYVIKRDILNPVVSRMYKTSNTDMFEVYTINIYLGYLY